MAGWNNCKHNHCQDCGCGNGEHTPYCDSWESLGIACTQCEKEKVNVMKAEKRVSYDVVVTMTDEEAHWIHAMLGSCNGIDTPAGRLRKAIGEATGSAPSNKLICPSSGGELPVINVNTYCTPLKA